MNKPFNKQQRVQHSVAALFIVAACVAVFLIFATPHKNSQSLRSYAATPSCTIDSNLLNSCRPLVGTSAGNYASTGGLTQLQYAEKRFNNPNALTNPSLAVTNTKHFDIMHFYNGVGSNALTSEELGYAKRANTVLDLNWKPADPWINGAGGNANSNAGIKAMADNIKTLGATKIWLTIFHEPENDVSSGNCTGNAKGASSGSPADYVKMWQNVHNIFAAEGTTNVVWVMNYMGFSGWNCLVPLLWPGNSNVDMIAFDKYASGSENFTTSTQPFYTLLSTTGDANHAYTSKPWGLNEFGYNSGTEANAISLWSSLTSSINSNQFPKLKFYVLFDSTGSGDSRVGYDINGSLNIAEQTAFNDFADGVQAMGSGPGPDNQNPTISVTSPASGATVSGTTTIGIAAADNVGVARVRIVWDGSNVIRDATSQGAQGWGATWDTTAVANGAHTINATAYDAAGNSASATLSLTVSNAGPPPNPVITSFSATPGTVTVGQTSTLGWASTNVTTCSVNPGGPQNTASKSWTTLAFNTTGVTTYTLVCKNSAGTTTSKTATVTVNPAPVAPGNVSLSANSTSIPFGGSVQLSWSSTGSSSCTLNPGSFTASGGTSSKTITNLQTSTTYTVTCSNSAGSTNSNSVLVNVVVSPPPPPAPTIISFIATPDNIAYGDSTTLSWQTSNVISGGCALAPGILTTTDGNASWTSAALTSSQSYTLTCKNSANVTVSGSVSVTVANQPPPPPPPAQDPTGSNSNNDPTVTDPTTGDSVVNASDSGSATTGDLITLDPSNITDSTKVKSIVKVEYYQDDTLIQTVTSAPFALDSSKLQAGNYNLTQRTYYADGSMSQQSQLVTINAKPAAKVTPGPGKSSPYLGLSIGLMVLVYVVALRWRMYRHAHPGQHRRHKGHDKDLPTIIMPTDPDIHRG